MQHNIDISAAPHLPPALRSQTESNIVTDFMMMLSGDLQLIEENGELRLLSYPAAAE